MMPLPMVHLAVAIQIRRLEQRIPSPDFLLGSIAPDSIHMRPGSGREDKQRVHLAEIPDPQHERVRLLMTQCQADLSSKDFAEGYVIHLLTDRLWEETVFDAFNSSIPLQLFPEDQRTLYYRETDQIDMNLYHQMPWRSEVWSKLAASQSHDFALLLTADEIARWRDRTLAWYDVPAHEPRIEPVHITDAMVRGFIDQAAAEIQRTFKTWKS